MREPPPGERGEGLGKKKCSRVGEGSGAGTLAIGNRMLLAVSLSPERIAAVWCALLGCGRGAFFEGGM